MRIKADLVLLLVAILWGSAFAAQRTAGLLGSVYVFNAARFLVAAVLLLPFALRGRLAPGQLQWMFAAGAVLFMASALQQAGLVTTTAGNAGFLTSLYVVLVPLVLFIGWREKARPMALIAVARLLASARICSPRPVGTKYWRATFSNLLAPCSGPCTLCCWASMPLATKRCPSRRGKWWSRVH